MDVPAEDGEVAASHGASWFSNKNCLSTYTES